MNITRQEIGTLNEVLRISLAPEDYNPQFESELKKYQKTMNMPGFRPGHVPVGLIKKKYGKSILIEELNKIVSESLESFINENKLDILGSPIPQTSDNSINNWDQPGNFEFNFEIGLAPQFSLTLPPSKEFTNLEIIVEDQKVDLYIEDLRRKYGKFSNPETADEQCILYGDFAELDENGEIKEGGISSKSTLAIASVVDEATKKTLIGSKKGDVLRINLSKAFNNNQDEISHLLNLPQEKAAGILSDFNYTVDTVNLVEKADLTQEFFDKLFAPGTVSSESELKDKVRAEIAAMYQKETDSWLKHEIEDHLLHELDIKLPDDFLRKWLQTAVEKPLTPDQIEKEYGGYARGMKLRLIENRIFRDQQMTITKEEIRIVAQQYILQQFSGYAAGLNDEILDSLVTRYLEKKESVERIIETLSSQKVFNYLKSIVKTKPEKITYDNFGKKVSSHHHH